MSEEDPDERRALRARIEGYLNLVRIHRAIEARALELLETEGIANMTMAQATALLVLVQERTPIRATRLAELLNVSTVTVGRFVRSLEQNGWLEREPDPDDARAMLLAPTEATYAELDRFIAVTSQLMREAYDGFAPGDIDYLVLRLADLRKNLYRVTNKPDADLQTLF